MGEHDLASLEGSGSSHDGSVVVSRVFHLVHQLGLLGARLEHLFLSALQRLGYHRPFTGFYERTVQLACPSRHLFRLLLKSARLLVLLLETLLLRNNLVAAYLCCGREGSLGLVQVDFHASLLRVGVGLDDLDFLLEVVLVGVVDVQVDVLVIVYVLDLALSPGLLACRGSLLLLLLVVHDELQPLLLHLLPLYVLEHVTHQQLFPLLEVLLRVVLRHLRYSNLPFLRLVLRPRDFHNLIFHLKIYYLYITCLYIHFAICSLFYSSLLLD